MQLIFDPRVEPAKAKVKAKPAVTFGAFAMDLVEDIEEGFKKPKHRQKWRNTLTTYAQPLFEVPIHEVTTEQILAVLQPIWLSNTETASRLRGRIERVLDAAKVKGLRIGENPARGRPSGFSAAQAKQGVCPSPSGLAICQDCQLHGEPAPASRCGSTRARVYNPHSGTLGCPISPS